jgi:predicted metal-dependent phosphoesterase TrpH
MLVDLHTHTWPASQCSEIRHDEYVERCVALGVTAIALTNHGSILDNLALAPRLARLGVVLLNGVEISTILGDFVVYSPDLEFLDSLQAEQEPLHRREVPEHAAVVWAHPAAGGGRSGSSYYVGLEEMAAPLIDAVEVFNGNWPADRYVTTAERIAADLGLPATAGSDAHTVAAIMRCATEVEIAVELDDGGAASTAALVAAIREGRVSPWREPPAQRQAERPSGRVRRSLLGRRRAGEETCES